MANGVDPEILAARAAQGAAIAPFDISALPIAEGRRLADAAARFFNDGGPEVARVEERSIGGRAARLYWPAESVPGALLFVHGGGWVMGSNDTHDRTMRVLAAESGRMVMGIEYRLSPEHRFPCGLYDCRVAWLELTKLGIEKLGIAGDSVGANMALALAVLARDHRAPDALALLYGTYAPEFDTESQRNNGGGAYGLTTDRLRWYWRQYLGEAEATPLAAPLHAKLAGLPPTYLCLAEFDALADDTRALAARLKAAGVPVEMDEWAGAVHGFLQMTRDVALARAAAAKIANFVRERL